MRPGPGPGSTLLLPRLLRFGLGRVCLGLMLLLLPLRFGFAGCRRRGSPLGRLLLLESCLLLALQDLRLAQLLLRRIGRCLLFPVFAAVQVLVPRSPPCTLPGDPRRQEWAGEVLNMRESKSCDDLGLPKKIMKKI